MSETMEYVNYLSTEIGPRPAGTEEERSAAEFIAEELETSSGLPTEIEDFHAPAGNDAPRAICAGLAVLGGVLSLLLPMFGLLAIILLLIAAALTIAEYLDRPILMRVLSRGASQNVVTRYNPGVTAVVGRRRARKVVVVAHYDSGKVRNELSGGLIKALPVLQKVSFWSVPALFVVVLIRSLFLASDTGFMGVLFTALVFVGVLLSVVPLVFALLHKVSPFNEAANSNASGVAVMMEVAGRVGRGRMTEEQIEFLNQYGEMQDGEEAAGFVPVVHGVQVVEDAEILPEGTELSYEVEPSEYREPENEPTSVAEAEDKEVRSADGLSDAKAAIAAMTGVAVPTTIAAGVVAEEAGSVVGEIVEDVVTEGLEPEVEGFAMSTAQKSMPAVPDWFAAAQAKAKANKPSADTTAEIRRSRYADAFDVPAAENVIQFDSISRPASADIDEQVERPVDVVVESADVASEEEVIAVVPELEVAPVEPTEVSVEEPVEAAPGITGDTANATVFDGYATEFKDALSDADIAMPSFLESSRFEPVPVSLDVAGGDQAIEIAGQEGVESKEEVSEKKDATPFAPVITEPAPEPIQPVSDFVGSITGSFEAIQVDEANPSLSTRIPVVIADTTGSFAAVSGNQGQRAPLADSASTAKSLLSMLPSINPSDPAETAAAADIANLRATLPSLSGTISAVSGPSNTGSAGATGVFAPVTEEMVMAAETEEELFVEDADDSDYQENFTETGAFAGPDYVEMPKSPIRNFFDRVFHRRDTEEVYYEDDFDGPAFDDEYEDGWDDRGSRIKEVDDEAFDDFDDEYVDRDGKWNGGALSALKDAAGSLGGKASQAAQGVAGKVREVAPKDDEHGRRRSGNVASRRGQFIGLADEPLPFDDAPRVSVIDHEAAADGQASLDPDVRSEHVEQVETFRNPFVNSEVWFVALGGELAGNAGMRAFVDAHSDELRGAIIIELDGLGAGTLSMVETEGSIKNVATSSRMKRYMRKMTQATGIPCPNVKFDWNDSAASYANSHGLKAMHLVGEMDGKPAYFAQENDTIESVDEQTLESSVECVMELLRLI